MITISQIKSIFKTDTERLRRIAFTHGAVEKIALEARARNLPDGLAPAVYHRNTKKSHHVFVNPTGGTLFRLFAQSIVIAFEQERVRQGN